MGECSFGVQLRREGVAADPNVGLHSEGHVVGLTEGCGPKKAWVDHLSVPGILIEVHCFSQTTVFRIYDMIELDLRACAQASEIHPQKNH